MYTEQRRHYSRIRFHGTARLLVADRQLPCTVLDLSLKGALIKLEEDLPDLAADEPCLLEISLQDDAIIVRMEANLAHRSGHHAGLVCREIDLDSITHLRRLLELNLGDAELLNREFSALISD
ncbi:MAG: hypothetical protein CVU28_02225 [Betaproteobacteria bacterium HGW-Betaproteobacteria-21]|nr:MAG: hypothetical protein CVU28_02225 [Betaproteobacteria bacterium HGW-Betaproteobacteria-21]